MQRHMMVILVLAIQGWVSVTDAAEPESVSQQQVLNDELIRSSTQAVIDYFMSKPGKAGLSVAVAWKNSVIVNTGAGMADPENGIAVTDTTTFRIGGASKEFAAAAILRLVDQGKLSLDDDFRAYVNDFDTDGRAVTIRQLLQHTSGIPNVSLQPKFLQTQPGQEFSTSELLAFVKDVPFSFEPGQGQFISNTGYLLVGLVVEAVSGQSYGDFIRNEFAVPLGLAATYFAPSSADVPDRAISYPVNPDTGQVQPPIFPWREQGVAQSMTSSAGDLVRWRIALQTGEVISHSGYQEMTGSVINGGFASPFGQWALGLWVKSDTDGIWPPGIYNEGTGSAGNAAVAYLPDYELTIAAITNGGSLGSDVLAMIVGVLVRGEAAP